MADIPNTRFLNFVDTPAAIHYSQFGEASVPLDPETGHVIDLKRFRKVSVLIGATSATSFRVAIGKISGSTLAQAYERPLDNQVHTFEVVGPQMTLWLRGGAADSDETVQLWVYLTS